MRYALVFPLESRPITHYKTKAGVENSCQLEPLDMNAPTLKLTALAAIVENLLSENGKDVQWSSEATSLVRKLTENSLDDLLRVYL